MECPNCHKEITGKKCPACGTEVPVQSRFCMQCGGPFDEQEPVRPVVADQDSGDDLDLEDRILCPDGTCTGIIINGRCSECGRPYPGQAPKGQ